MGIYQFRFLDRVPAHAAVNDSVDLVRRAKKTSAAAFVNAVLRRITREHPNPGIGLNARLAVQRWVPQYGAMAAQIAHASLMPPARYIRVGTKSRPKRQKPTDIPGPSPSPKATLGLPLPGHWLSGRVPLLDLQPGMAFLDLCAAPGNKTAQALETSLRAVACDLHLSRARTLTTLEIPVVSARRHPAAALRQNLRPNPCRRALYGHGHPRAQSRNQMAPRPEAIADLRQRQSAILRNALRRAETRRHPCLLHLLPRAGGKRTGGRGGGRNVVRTMNRIPGRDPGDGFFAASRFAIGQINPDSHGPYCPFNPLGGLCAPGRRISQKSKTAAPPCCMSTSWTGILFPI